MTKTRRRFPHRVFGVGQEPDPRFTFANERTFLAWIRTSLGLLAGAVVVATLGDKWGAHRAGRVSAALALVAAVGALAAWRRWQAHERALRLGDPLPGFVPGAVLVAVLSLFAGTVAVLGLFR